ncbi:phosphosulfolactate phosphohydrolase-like enzyme [Thermanaerovibrio velox DSM 12556]|uniref:Probable 2-phosphosulfolactate phosphatase n=1 Tax=Thermanaerovibrio velox DSM 12556 TaxID=926567 RepID=H0UNA6_9BACT|nr:2-phosphosulfolactate phosphatase [Thermanaerovibrio velox]EHM10391.1 phosphosulfolactate phosphohydrolase-like enzyme [Thermanaerovibrio velox DSM 12556]
MICRVEVFSSPGEISGSFSSCFVVDMLRATTQMSVFFELGGLNAILSGTVEEARELRDRLGEGWSLWGERGGVAPVGFDGGNSPRELMGAPKDRRLRIIMTTTNGTNAILKAIEVSNRVYPFCMRNLGAAAALMAREAGALAVLCAGHEGAESYEDVVAAGALLDRLIDIRGGSDVDLSASALRAIEEYRGIRGDLMGAILKRSSHAMFLADMGFLGDIEEACNVDVCDLLVEARRFGEAFAELHRGM